MDKDTVLKLKPVEIRGLIAEALGWRLYFDPDFHPKGSKPGNIFPYADFCHGKIRPKFHEEAGRKVIKFMDFPFALKEADPTQDPVQWQEELMNGEMLDWTRDADAILSLEENLSGEERHKYVYALGMLTGDSEIFKLIHASPLDKARAWLMVKG